jgi:hypothetical protein
MMISSLGVAMMPVRGVDGKFGGRYVGNKLWIMAGRTPID